MRTTVRRQRLQPIRERIRVARELAKLSRAELARRVGVCASAAVQWEAEQGTAPSVENLSRIAVITGVAFEWLATGRGDMRHAADLATPAVVPGAFAQDWLEELMLNAFRAVPRRKREVLVRFVEQALK